MTEKLAENLQKYAEEVAGTVLEVFKSNILWTPIILKCCPYLDITLLQVTETNAFNTGVDIVYGSPTFIPFKNGYFNVVLTALVVKSVDEKINDMLGEFNRILRDHGMLILVENAIGEGELGGWLEKLDKTGFATYDWTKVMAKEGKIFIIQAFK